MTVWAKLRSWIGASASGLNLDNEFNNIYTGLNESQNGSRPSGYNDVRLTYSTDQLTVKGETKVNGVNVDLNSTITVSGATGWRFVVTTTGGVVSVETIPGGEITANTLVYTPTPVFNNTLNGYYSSVNTTRRIIGIIWYDATTKILEAIPYSHGAKRSDDIWESNGAGIDTTGLAARHQYTSAFQKMRGENITCVDNGAGTTDAEGFRITFNKDGIAVIQLNIAGTVASVGMNKNGASFKDILFTTTGNNIGFHSITTHVSKGDYFTFVNRATATGCEINSPTILFNEF